MGHAEEQQPGGGFTEPEAKQALGELQPVPEARCRR